MALSFKISAPGRIVLAGEHSAIYDKIVVMAGLNLRTNLEFCELPMSGLIKIDFPRVHLQKSILHRIVADYFSHEKVAEIRQYPIRLLRYVNYFIDMNHLCDTREQRFSLQMFFYLFCTIKNLAIKPFHLRVFTNLPSSPGLGSSTSFAVCLAACFLHWERLQEGGGQSNKFNDDEMTKINYYASFCEENIQQNTLAFMDADICVRGGIRRYQRRNYNRYSTKIFYEAAGPRILLINTNIVQNKGQRAQQMVDLRCRNLYDFFSLLDELNTFAMNIWGELTKPAVTRDYSRDSPISWDLHFNIKNEIWKNQLLLKNNNLSDPKVDKVCAFANNFELYGKLTGFQGGYVYIPLPPYKDEKIEHIKAQFLEQYPDCISSTFGYDGLRIDQ